MATGTMTRTTNPALSDAAIQRAATDLDPGWAAPTATPGAPPVAPRETMTMGGVVWACAALIVLLVAAAWFGWSSVDQTSFEDPITGEIVNTTQTPGWIWIAAIGALGVAIVTVFKPNFARLTGPLYALTMGTVVGAISAVFEANWSGIVLQAVMCTIGVFLMMLFLYATRIIKVTRRLAIGIVAATGGVALTYFVAILWSLVTGDTPSIFEAGAIGIGFSILVVGIAAFNLLLDFNFIEQGVQQGLPKGLEWYAAFGLLITLVWLYLEILRLLGKLRG